MLLSQKSTIKLNNSYSNIIGHMCYAAYKLWNVCNYERMNYKKLDFPVNYPDWYYQKKAHKDDLWYKQLPSQTAQEVCKLLDKSWRSFYALQKSHGIENPKPPKYKHDNMAITYMQNGISHANGSDNVRLSIPKGLKGYMLKAYGIDEKFLFLKNKIFKGIDIIKQIKIYPPRDGYADIIIIYEVPDSVMLPDNGRYLAIDLGLHNLMTCYNSSCGETFIVGRKYLSICNYYNKEIARVQSQWHTLQSRKGVKRPRSSGHIKRLYNNRNNAIQDYLHKVTRYIVSYCKANSINTVVIGDITGIRKDNDLGHVTNQKLHSLPYNKLYIMLEYKLALCGISFVKQEESYSSQVSPLKASVIKVNAKKSNRVHRGLYKDSGYVWNADCVGAFNILRKYLKHIKSDLILPCGNIKPPYIVKVAA